MSKRLKNWVKELQTQLSDYEIAAGIENGDIDCPPWLAYSPCTSVGFAVWDTNESDGGLGLYSLNAKQQQ